MTAYVCPMCPGIESQAPGPCPHCGMSLEQKVPRVGRNTLYKCPTHPSLQERGSGACPRCGMALEPHSSTPFEESEEVLETEADRLEERGETVIFVSVDTRTAGLLAGSDPVKASTPGAVQELRRLGLELHVVTGDNVRTARAVAKQLDIGSAEASVSPQGKAEFVKSLRARGRAVLMAGDGINDAPTLADSDVGVAMGTGTDDAIESAGVTLVKGDLRGIVKALRLGRATLKNIRRNLFFALVYNAIVVPVAAGVLVPFL